MSKFVSVKVNVQDEDVLKQSLDDLGCVYDCYESPKPLRLYDTKANIHLKDHLLGFVKVGNAWELVGDDMHVNPFLRKYQEQLEQTYASKKIEKHARNMGCIITSREKQKNGVIKIKMMLP